MAKLIEGINGGFSGKIGNVVGVLRGKTNYMRRLPTKSTVPPSPAQLSYRLRFAVVSSFLRPLAHIQEEWYSQETGMKSRRNLSQAYHTAEAVIGNYPEFTINYGKVLITRGELSGIQSLHTKVLSGNQLLIEWEDNSAFAFAKADDLLLTVAFNPVTREFEYDCAARRAEGTFVMQLPDEWNDTAVHCWVSVIDREGQLASTSQYAGMIELSGVTCSS